MLGPTLAQAIAPPPDLTVSGWADENRILSGKSAAEPGPWRTERAEYVREIMNAFSDDEIETVAVMASSQVGKTEIVLNVIAYFIDLDPCPIMWALPTLGLARSYSIERLAPMIKDTPALAGKVADPKSRDSGNTQRSKEFPGGQLNIVTAQSASELSGRPVRVALADETDRMDATAEGDPLALMRKRTQNFWNRKIGLFSSPRDKGTSKIEAQYQASDQRKFYVPCPHCGHMQVLRHAQVHWERQTDENGEPLTDERGKHNHLPETACYVCEDCGAAWTDAQRHAAVRRGEWRKHGPAGKVAGFWLNALYSPWVSLASYVAEFLEAKKLPDTLRVFVNTMMAETWEEQGEAVDDDALGARAEDWGNLVPAGVAIIAASVDTQDDRLEIEVLGWGRDEENWSLDYIQLYGSPGLPDVWNSLESVLAQTYETEDGRVLPIRAMVIDTGGHHTDQAYAFCKPRWRRHVWAIVGRAKGLGVPVWPQNFSRANKGRVPLFAINVDEAKKVVTDRLKIIEPGPGYCHFPTDRHASYYRQFAAEQLVTRYKRGFPVRVWEKKSGRRNEALDLRAYNYAALKGLESQRVSLARECDRIERMQAGPAGQPKTVTAPRPATAGVVLPSDPYLQ